MSAERTRSASQRLRNVQRHREHVNRIREMGADTGMFDVRPTTANFGHVKVGQTYRMAVRLKNIGSRAARLRINPLVHDETSLNLVQYNGMPGSVAPGMSASIGITLVAESLGPVNRSLEVVSESFTYHIPITAVVLDALDFDVHAHRNAMLGKGRLMQGVEVVDSDADAGSRNTAIVPGSSTEPQPPNQLQERGFIDEEEGNRRIRLCDISRCAAELKQRVSKPLRHLERALLDDDKENGWEDALTSAAVSGGDVYDHTPLVDDNDLTHVPRLQSAYWDHQCQQLCPDYTAALPRQQWRVDPTRPFAEMRDEFCEAQEQQEKRLRGLESQCRAQTGLQTQDRNQPEFEIMPRNQPGRNN